MPYMTEITRPPICMGSLAAPPKHQIFGMPADSFIRVAAPLTTGALSAVALVYSIRGNHQAATALALVGVISSSIVSAVQVYDLETQRAVEIV